VSLSTTARLALGLLTGLWVTIGAAIPIGYVSLRLLRAANGGELGPELLAQPAVVVALLAGYGVAAAIGGWAAGWITIERRRRLTSLLSAAHVGTWLFVLVAGGAPFEPPIVLGLAGAAVVGTIAGISSRARQVARSAEPVGG